MERRLDEGLPERGDSSYRHESPYVDFSDSLSQSTFSTSSRPQTPSSRRGSVLEEIQRQSAVFFDDSDLYGDEDAIVT